MLPASRALLPETLVLQPASVSFDHL